ncbi:hypothetical protein OEZ86_002949 [Tetradesmus obliquus]|nr:hypothetical protein OEZ86_002949 [Tetradesmus obliquus]
MAAAAAASDDDDDDEEEEEEEEGEGDYGEDEDDDYCEDADEEYEEQHTTQQRRLQRKRAGRSAAAGGARPSAAAARPSVKSLWDWYTAPVSGGMSVQQCEEKQPPDTTWRSKQPHGKARWREVRLILDRIKELQVTSGSIRAALEAAEGEREELKLAVPGYSRHLAALAKEKNKEKGSKSG